jgi:acetyltransferase-like isoleucine patch superfamily enzyme
MPQIIKKLKKISGIYSFLMNKNPRYAAYSIGRFSFGYPKVRSWGENATLKIGNFCSIAQGVNIVLGGEHRVDWVTTYPFNKILNEYKYIKGHPATKGDIIIGNDVWIGMNATILSGVTIGDGAVIGANSLVTNDVEPYTIVGGNPAKPIRKRFDQQTIDRLLRIKWWDWDIEKIKRNVPDLLSNQIEQFLDKNEP